MISNKASWYVLHKWIVNVCNSLPSSTHNHLCQTGPPEASAARWAAKEGPANYSEVLVVHCMHNVYLIITTTTSKIRHNKSHRSVLGWGESSSSECWINRDDFYSLSLLVTRESTLLAMERKLHLGEDSGQGFTQIIPYPTGVMLPKLGNFTQAWVKLPRAGVVTLPRLGKATKPS